MKDWLLQRQFVRDAITAANGNERPRIFALAQKDILETMKDDLDVQAKELADKKIADFLSLVDETQIVTTKGKLLYIGGEIPDDATMANLKAEAVFLSESQLWKIIYETPKELAQRAMFVDNGTIENQLIKGRAILYTLATQQKILDILHGLSTSA